MSTFVCSMIGVRNCSELYVILVMLEQRNHTEVYNCVDIIIFGSSVVVFLGFGIGDGTGWEE